MRWLSAALLLATFVGGASVAGARPSRVARRVEMRGLRGFVHGFRPAFAPRSVDHAPRRARLSLRDRLPVSTFMSLLLRIDLPAVGPRGEIAPLIKALGLPSNGRLARELRAISERMHTIGGGRIVFSDDHPNAVRLEGGFGFIAGREQQQHVVTMLLARGVARQEIARYALAELFASTANTRGEIDATQLRGRRSEIETLITALDRMPRRARIKQQVDAPFGVPHVMTHLASGVRGAVVAEQRRLREKPMALVKLVDKIRPNKRDPYDTHIFFRQHMMRSNATLAHVLGPRTTRVGKNYSVSEAVVAEQTASVPWLSTSSLMGNVVADRDNVLSALHVRGSSPNLYHELLDELRSVGVDGGKHFQVIDEGADALLYLNALVKDRHRAEHKTFKPISRPLAKGVPWYGFGSFAQVRHHVSGVEGTRDGARKLARAKLAFGVVNLAEAPLKTHIVGALIGWSVVEDLQRTISDLTRQGHRRPRTILVGGYGSTGRTVTTLLRALGYRVIVKEPRGADGKLSANGERAVRELGRHNVISEVPERFDAQLVVGCVGIPWLSPREIARLPSGAWLASASSSNKEFSLRARDGFSTPSYEALAKQAQTVTFAGKKTLLGVSGSPTHWHQPLKRGNQELLVLNGGYPVNLTGGPDTIAPLYAQLIRSMMLLASRQARDLPRGTKGLVALERDGQRQLAQRFMAIVRKLRPPPPAPVRALLEAAYKQTLADLAR